MNNAILLVSACKEEIGGGVTAQPGLPYEHASVLSSSRSA